MKTIINPLTICVLVCAVLIAGCDMNGDKGRLDQESDFMEMVPVLGGNFTMGDNIISKPAHSVTVDAFYMGKFQVMQDQFFNVMLYNPSFLQGDDPVFLPMLGEDQGERPVENVTWYEALMFCNLLSMREEFEPVYSINGETNPNNWGNDPKITPSEDDNDLTPIPPDPDLLLLWDSVKMDIRATGYRLPTEAEWEYAAKGGIDQKPFKYSGNDNLDTVAWYKENRRDEDRDCFTHEVGVKMPNTLGIYDMTGNVEEWCWDWYDDAYYSTGDSENPEGPSDGTERVLRGGGINNNEHDDELTNVGRFLLPPYKPNSYSTGFRVVRSMQ